MSSEQNMRRSNIVRRGGRTNVDIQNTEDIMIKFNRVERSEDTGVDILHYCTPYLPYLPKVLGVNIVQNGVNFLNYTYYTNLRTDCVLFISRIRSKL